VIARFEPLFGPILNDEVWNALEIANIPGYDNRLMFQCDCRNAQVHFADIEFGFLQRFGSVYGGFTEG
jgi:hypothetical protein